MPTRHRRVLLAVLSTASALAMLGSATAPAQAAALPIGDLNTALWNNAVSPHAVAGANDWNCRPTAAHPNPVVLLHGTFSNLGQNFVAMSPMLKNAGYCVFATNFGMTWMSADRVGGLGSEITSGNRVAAFIDKVLATTGAQKVDVVGHSQGGAIGINYIKLHGGANKVAHWVGWGHSANGTTLSGIQSGAASFGILGLANTTFAMLGAQGLVDQQVGSAYSKQLWATPGLPTGPKYLTVQTTKDAVVTPYRTQSLPGATNKVIQDFCPASKVGHIGFFLDKPTLNLTMNFLTDGPADYRPSCEGQGLEL